MVVVPSMGTTQITLSTVMMRNANGHYRAISRLAVNNSLPPPTEPGICREKSSVRVSYRRALP